MAENIREIYHLFNPDEVLLNDDLEKYYVEIEENELNIKDLQNRLELGLETSEPIKLLFTGHRGSGIIMFLIYLIIMMYIILMSCFLSLRKC